MLMLRPPSSTMQLCVSKSLKKLYFSIAYIPAGVEIIFSCIGKMWIYWGKSSWCFIGWCMPSECKSTRSRSILCLCVFYQSLCLESMHVFFPHFSLSFLLLAFNQNITNTHNNNNNQALFYYVELATLINLLGYIKGPQFA